jgi:hypothetical protein
MDALSTIPNGKALLETLMLTPEMLRSLQKVRPGIGGCAPLNPPPRKGKEGRQLDIANERQSPRARPPWAWSLRAVGGLRLAAREI